VGRCFDGECQGHRAGEVDPKTGEHLCKNPKPGRYTDKGKAAAK
jgi:hypothetical protein